MLQTVEATIDENGNVQLREAVSLKGRRRALVTILDQPSSVNEAAILSESALVKEWSTPQEDEAWKHLVELPDVREGLE